MTRTPHATDARAAWVVVADHGRARLFVAPQPAAPLQELETLLNPVAGQRESELVSDRPGRIVKGRGGSSRGVGQEQTHKARAADQFANAVCARLAKARQAGELGRLYLIAEPHFLGLLRQHMEPATTALIAGEIDKDVTQRSAEDLRELLPRQL
ncbi:MAG: host attachment protein [Stagnimonas sp.]|nr:host attachment protein [Stagnimonas sp.]